MDMSPAIWHQKMEMLKPTHVRLPFITNEKVSQETTFT